MSRLGKTPIPIPKGVEVKFEETLVTVKGGNGVQTFEIPKGLKGEIADEKLLVIWSDEIGLESSFYGFYRSMINNLIVGVSKGFEKVLTMIGVGYRAAITGNNLVLQVGYSNPKSLQIPEGIKVAVEKSTRIIITGVDKQKVGQFAATVRATRPPEPYKGKGIRYENEYVRKKAGKAAKAGK